jgi:hypothetical protein
MVRTPAGHIERLPSGSWRVKVYAGTDPLTGREIRLRKTCKTERAAQIELGKLLEQAAAGRQPETASDLAKWGLTCGATWWAVLDLPRPGSSRLARRTRRTSVVSLAPGISVT